MFELPSHGLTEPVLLADWLELYAIISPDQNSSQGDLESALRVAAPYDVNGQDKLEQTILDVFSEIERRYIAAGEAYPFDINYQGNIQVKSNWESFPAYTFCLCISYFRLPETTNIPKLFERLSCIAAKKYIGGGVVGFGWPRSDLPVPFEEAMNKMCELIGEGLGYRTRPELDPKDDTLDLVAWIDFADKQPSKLLMFGQCASGRNWEDKLGELQPDEFCNQWMQISPLTSPLKSFFIPHRIQGGKDRWEFVARKTGILFDRCRIAFWAHQEKTDFSSYVECTKNILSGITA